MKRSHVVPVAWGRAKAAGGPGRPGDRLARTRVLGMASAGVVGLVGLVAATLLAATPAQAARHALLVGVADYGSPRHNLEGPVNDVLALRDVLVRRWGVPAGNVQTLTDAQATRANILRALQGLQARTAAGDEIVVFFSGHGTSSLDASQVAPMPDGTGAFIPYGLDASTPQAAEAGLLIGRRDLLPLYRALDEGGRRLWIISDSCFSGNQARSAGQTAQALTPKYLALPTAPEIISQQDYLRQRMQRYQPPPPYPYRHAVFLGAASEGEMARDIRREQLGLYPTITGKAGGALTDALLRVLDGQLPADVNTDGLLSLDEVHRAVGDFMGARAYGHAPQRLPSVQEDRHGAGARPVLDVRGVAAPMRSAPLQPLRVALAPGADFSTALAGVPDILPLPVGGAAPGPAGDAEVMLLRTPAGRAQVLVHGGLLADMEADDAAGLRARLIQLGWTHRLKQLAQAHQSAVLPLALEPAAFGTTFAVGERVHFSLRTAKPAWLVLVNADAAGKVSVLYPSTRRELEALAADTAHAIPGSAPHLQIMVQPPLGMDRQFAFAFHQRPADLERLLGAVDMNVEDPRLRLLEQMVRQAAGGLQFGIGELLTVAPPSAANGAAAGR